MRIAFVINEIITEKPHYTTILLAYKLQLRGHEVYFIQVGDLSYRMDGKAGGTGYRAPDKKYATQQEYLEGLKSDPVKKQISSEDLDILMLRNNPADEIGTRAWADIAGIVFGQVAERQGVIVLNDPYVLANALNKMYFQHYPKEVRPHSIITRNPEEIREFFEKEGKDIILKPLQGSGGRNVFVIKKEEHSNLNQIIETISREGYIIAQEYLPEAVNGDTRVFVMNGKPLMYKGKYAAVQRVNEKEDIRSNVHVGGTTKAVEVGENVKKLIELISPKLIKDGMFLVGIDVVKDKILEINVFSPGVLMHCCELQGVDFTVPIIEAMEKKIRYRDIYGNALTNSSLATLD